MTEWFDYEINGYPEDSMLPTYRVLKNVPIYAFNPSRGYIPVDLSYLYKNEPVIYKEITTIHLANPIAMLTKFAKSETTLYSDLPSHDADLLKSLYQSRFKFQLAVNPVLIVSLVASIRNKVKDWALLLESKGILGDGLLFSPEEKKEAQSVTYNTINNHGNGMTVLGDVNNDHSVVGGTVSNVQQQNITGDFSALERQLKEHGIDDADINELKDVIDQTPKPETKEDVEKGFGAWIGKMTGKAITGAIKIAGTAAPALLTNYICHHYGIPV